MMKRLPLLSFITFVYLFCDAQNVGIGTSTPGFPLSFPNTLGDKISLWGSSGNHYGLGIQSFTFQVHTDISAADIAFGYGSSNSFTENMRLKGTGNLGIGTSNPGAKLHIASGLSGYSGSYFPGMIVEGNTATYFNILTPNANESGILFGNPSGAASGGIIYNNGNSNSLQFRTNGNITRMTIDNGGRLGIGVNPTIGDGILDVNGRMRIQSGGDIVHSAGIWMNNINNSVLAAFIGMKDDNNVGFYGGGIGWGFSMNTQTGALLINGNEGIQGQVIQSNGSSFAPTWVSSTNALYNNTVAVEDAGSQTLTTADNFVNLNGMNYSFNVPGNAKLFVSFDVPVYSASCAFCGSSSMYVDIDIDGAFNARYHWDVANGAAVILSASKIITLSAGFHTVNLQGSGLGNNNIFGGGGTYGIKRMNLQIIPQ